jgi:hypothetical protein
MNITLNSVISIAAISGVIALGAYHVRSCKQEQIEVKENSKLVDECILIASGENGILEFQEGVDLARELGYKGTIFPNEMIQLSQDRMELHPTPRLLIGYTKDHAWNTHDFRYSHEVTPQNMKKYIQAHKK